MSYYGVIGKRTSAKRFGKDIIKLISKEKAERYKPKSGAQRRFTTLSMLSFGKYPKRQKKIKDKDNLCHS